MNEEPQVLTVNEAKQRLEEEIQGGGNNMKAFVAPAPVDQIGMLGHTNLFMYRVEDFGKQELFDDVFLKFDKNKDGRLNPDEMLYVKSSTVIRT